MIAPDFYLIVENSWLTYTYLVSQAATSRSRLFSHESPSQSRFSVL